MSAPGEQFPSPTREVWLARKLGLRDLFEGVTTPEQRRERVRKRILELGAGSGDFYAGKNRDGEPETWGSVFERLYGVPL